MTLASPDLTGAPGGELQPPFEQWKAHLEFGYDFVKVRFRLERSP
jgi:hypothetical protein